MSSLNKLAKQIAEGVKARGFRTPTEIGVCPMCGQDPTIAKLGLVGTEIAEAMEAARKNDRANFDEEIADTFIRLFDRVGAMGIDLDAILAAKEKKNANRPKLHGKTC